MELKFTKMQGIGNDYIYLDGFSQNLSRIDESALARVMSQRRFSVGSDGVIFLYPTPDADVEMRMYNADRSRGEICGNGLRCVAKYCHDAWRVPGDTLRIKTDAGIRVAHLIVTGGEVTFVTVGMGRAQTMPGKIPILGDSHRFTITAQDRTFEMFACSVGNPHGVTFLQSLDLDVERYGRLLGRDRMFPGGANISFARPLRSGVLQARVWERGSGETMACGSGACAIATAAVEEGYAEVGIPVTVLLPGGNLTVTVAPDGEITLGGPAVTVYRGVYTWEV